MPGTKPSANAHRPGRRTFGHFIPVTFVRRGMPERPGVFHNPRTSMLNKKPADIPSSEVTDERSYLRRREFLQIGAGLVGAAAGGVLAACGSNSLDAAGGARPPPAPHTPLANIAKKMVTTEEPINKI